MRDVWPTEQAVAVAGLAGLVGGRGDIADVVGDLIGLAETLAEITPGERIGAAASAPAAVAPAKSEAVLAR